MIDPSRGMGNVISTTATSDHAHEGRKPDMTNAADVAKAEDERAIAAKEEAAKEEKADRETIERLKLRSTVAKSARAEAKPEPAEAGEVGVGEFHRG
jgi:hypothetical protein